MPKPRLQVAIVEWYDHYSVSGWHDTTELADKEMRKGVQCISIGILAYEDADVVKLTTTTSADSGFADLMCILRPTIKAMATVPLADYTKTLRAGMKCATMQSSCRPVPSPSAKDKTAAMRPKPKKPRRPKGPDY